METNDDLRNDLLENSDYDQSKLLEWVTKQRQYDSLFYKSSTRKAIEYTGFAVCLYQLTKFTTLTRTGQLAVGGGLGAFWPFSNTATRTIQKARREYISGLKGESA